MICAVLYFSNLRVWKHKVNLHGRLLIFDTGVVSASLSAKRVDCHVANGRLPTEGSASKRRRSTTPTITSTPFKVTVSDTVVVLTSLSTKRVRYDVAHGTLPTEGSPLKRRRSTTPRVANRRTPKFMSPNAGRDTSDYTGVSDTVVVPASLSTKRVHYDVSHETLPTEGSPSKRRRSTTPRVTNRRTPKFVSPNAGRDTSHHTGGVRYVYNDLGDCDHRCYHCGAAFWTARDRCQQIDVPEFKIRLYNADGARGYELPSSNTLGAIVFDSRLTGSTEFDVVIKHRGGLPKRINKLHKSYRSLQFLLLFIYGQLGFHTDLKLRSGEGTKKERRVTMLAYYSYQLHPRKIQDFLEFLKNQRTFGAVTGGAILNLEFQKRGLPHCHTLLWVDSTSKIREPENVDQFISAELPDPSCALSEERHRGTDKIFARVSRPLGESSDAACLLRPPIDEIQNYLEGRFVCPYVALWRIYKFDIHCREPTVRILSVHLEDMQRVSFRDRDKLESVVNLLEFVWYANRKSWSPRQNSRSSIGRLAYVHPTSEPHMRHWVWLEMKKSRISQWKRHLQSTGQKHDIPGRVLEMTHIPNYHLNDDNLQGYMLFELEIILNNYGKTLQLFRLGPPPSELLDMLANRLFMEERNYNQQELQQQIIESVPKLNETRRKIYDLIINANGRRQQELIFVYRHGGTGKTFLWKTIISTLRCEGKILTEESLCKVTKNSRLGKLLADTDLIIWDEAPMNDRRCFEALDRSLRDMLTMPDHLFGGKSVLLGGDFWQTLPVKKGASKIEIIALCIFESELWRHFKLFTLTKNMRLSKRGVCSEEQSLISSFASWLLDLRDGRTGEPDQEVLENSSWVDFPFTYCIPNDEQCLSKLTDMINSKVLEMVEGETTTYLSHAEATPLEQDGAETEMLYPTEHLNTLKIPGFPPHQLPLDIKPGLGSPLKPKAGLSDAAHAVPVPETFHEQTNDELTKAEIKQMEADDQVIQTILLGLPEDIYAAVDSCETAQEILFTFTVGESIESDYHRFLKLMNDFKRNKHFPEKIASNLKFLNNLQPEWSRHVTIVHQTKDLHTTDYTQLYDFLKYNQKEVDDLRAKRLAKTQDPLALMANSNNPFNYPVFHLDLPSSSTYIQQPLPNNNYNPQPSFNQNYIQQPMPNPEDITDPTTAMNMTLVLMAKAFKLNYSTPTNNNQRISSNPRNRQIAQSGNQVIQNSGVQNVGNQNGLIVVPGIANQNENGNFVVVRAEGNSNGNNEAGIQLQDEEFDLMTATTDLDEIEEVNANCILMANLQQASTSGTQTDKAHVYDSDGSAEVQLHDKCYNDEIFNMFTQEEQYTELLEPIPEPHQVPQNDSNVISEVSSVEQGGGTVEQHPVTVEETRAYQESSLLNLVAEVEKVNMVNCKMRETNAKLTTELARYKNQEKCFEISQEKYDKLERCYQQSVYQEQCLTKKINALHLSSGKQITALNEEISNLNKQLSKEKSTVSSLQEEKKRLKSNFKIREDELFDKQIQLENKIKELDNILVKTSQSIQTIHMLSPKPDSFYDTEQKMALEKHDPPVVYDSEETLELAQESRLKMKQLNKEIKPANYTKINHLSGVFVSQTAKSREELYFSNTSKTANVSKSISIPNEEFSDDTTPSVARKFLNEVKSTIVTLQRVVKQKMTLDIHNWSSSVHQEIHKIVKDEIFPIVNQVDARVQNFEIQFLKEAAKFVRDFQSLAKEADESLAKHKALEWEIECQIQINPFKNSREEKSMPNKPIKASVKTNSITVPQPHVITKKVVNSDSNGFSST
ncbi:integrase, catalytic region, zinc finger, CCHC-type containing protein [Tanacetum coccineum]|uniref:ATP-dependent DNA helicase n=1 Tax=Tanacetum coccineum TaxID=301880 RepID=A0ABQ5FTL3_9ASTR